MHVELDGLEPGREYFYRFRTGSYLSPAGRTRTAPDPARPTGPLTICAASCAQYEHGYFTAYRHLADEHPDLVLHLGDYRYEHAADTYRADSGNVRSHVGPETVTLAHCRQRYAQYKSDKDLQAAHAARPWIADLGRPRGQRHGLRGPDPNRGVRARKLPLRRAAELRLLRAHAPASVLGAGGQAPTCSSIAR